MTFFVSPSSTSSSLILCLPLLLHSIVLLCNGVVAEVVVVEAVIDPIPSSSSSEHITEMDIKRASWLYDSFLEAYGETVDTIVGLQTSNWNFIPRYNSIDESKINGMCLDINTGHIDTSIPKFLREKRKPTTGTTTTLDKNKEGNATLRNGFQHDSDADIDRYLTELAEGCSQNIEYGQIGAKRYQKECLDVLRSIVYESRCTTRYDSRVNCNGGRGSHSNSTMITQPRELIGEHFGQESLNIVIVGAGPIGLLLANALSMLPQRQQRGVLPPIRILILEARADAPGLKKPYTRNWQAQLNLLHFRNTIDPRLTKIFASMTEDKDYHDESVLEFVLPLNVIETLLLLSNRDMGATKFLYGINQLELVDVLKDVPNLVLVDGTGHRLEPLRRGGVCDGFGEESDVDCDAHREAEPKKITYNHRTPPAPEIPWLNEENSDFYEYLTTFQLDFSRKHDWLAERGHGLHVAQTGDIMYPIDEETKVAKTIYWIDVHGATLTSKQDSEWGYKEEENLYADGGALCDWCEKWWYDESIKNNDKEAYLTNLRCDRMCYTSYFASSTDLLREDIKKLILENRFEDTFVYQSDGWFPLMGYSFNPSTELAHQVQRVLDDHGYSYDPVGMPLRDLYPALEGSMDKTKLSDVDLDLVSALKRISLHSNTTKWPTVTQFVQQPFIYTNGLKKKNKCNKHSSSLGDLLEDAPMIRIGDSFTTGDGLGK